MVEITPNERSALHAISQMSDPDKLRNVIRNARLNSSPTVEAAAFDRLCFVQPEATPGTVEHDVWQAVHALEQMLLEERGKTVRLTRTRQKIARHGEAKTAADLTMKSTPSQGFSDLLERRRPELTFEAIVLRHPKTFESEILEAAKRRLLANNVDLSKIIQTSEGG